MINDPKFDRLTVEDGLSQMSAYCIFQDSRGFLWIGTHDGLNRYDGYEFRVFKNDPMDPKTISDNYVVSITEDSRGYLWIATYSHGLNMYDPDYETFTRFYHSDEDTNSIGSNYLQTLFYDDEDILWIGTWGNGLDALDLAELDSGPVFRHFRYDENNIYSLNNNNVTSIIAESPGRLCVGTSGGGLNCFDKSEMKFHQHQYNYTDTNSLSSNNISSVFKSSAGDLWVGTYEDGLNRLDHESRDVTRYTTSNSDLSSNRITSIYEIEDMPGYIWIGSWEGGLNILDVETGEFKTYKNDPANPFSISNSSVRTIFRDASGVVWMGTGGGGLTKYDPQKNKFAHYNTRNGLLSNFILSFCEDDKGKIWIGTSEGGLNLWDRDLDAFYPYDRNRKLKNLIIRHAVRTLHFDPFGHLWIGTDGNGLIRYHPEKRTLRHFIRSKDDTSGISSNFITTICEDIDNGLWIGTINGGLNRYDRKTDVFVSYVQDSEDSTSISENTVMSLFLDEEKTLWIGTYSAGLNKFDREEETFTQFYHDPYDTTTLGSNSILHIYSDSKNRVWVGANNGGLNLIDMPSNRCKCFHEIDGLPNETVYAVVEDDSGYLWLSSNRGISRFDPDEEIFENYDYTDGLQGNEFNLGAYLKTSRGEILFGGANGFNMFHPDELRDNAYVPPVVLTDFQIFNRSVVPDASGKSPLRKSLQSADVIRLSHSENVFSFAFAALNYANAWKNQYQYKMEGFDDWTDAGSRRFVTYTNLSPGRYTFRVKGSNNDGVWNEEGRNIELHISPPWWDTVWAYIAYLLIFSAGVLIIDRFQRVRLTGRERERARIREAELRVQAAESEARAIQAENERKSLELEGARAMQISMLPDKMPDCDKFDIAVYMKTATEIGGDYYDFINSNGTLTAAIGDATGHGLKAGTMVSVFKGMFVSKAKNMETLEFFNSCNNTIIKMNLWNLFMALTMIKVNGDTMTVCSAGMPPAYVYRKATGDIEEITIKGMPLGAFQDFEYAERHVELKTGDTVMFMTDGIVELFNAEKEMFDYDRVRDLFREVASESPQQIIDHIVKAGEEWRGDMPQNDDITFMVLKRK